ncbi:MAG: 2-C-methyl-D-erythritol 2,4-cyclodiphosphate synthase [Flavobacteriales bacterium]|nr:2-C-methyl-D-erythritol 2,4-cyclodiphosphate synthase [Flavobacteriales bacterium]MBK6753884.1 2-C-methyl-D-erythritol 2,4-cyclodiphosphate synthase [Flavobacteriales bacterium]MBK7751695.1 2-C-methyl-D-erythritol 2,4-cyclodiphosphate synthase [Flavobacteriales bacterium]MBK9076428.1 2-C-methyl-D-erythritol 2,4-cyclodiphosphate synthase [Flavobacteriales bacterium]MBK9539486.1 2-C-methyl-D-erythritol 2,4-cyclodiphosphate synthase [Flavobacteriales bacterium]
MNFRVGFGFDVHRLAEGRALWLGGVRIEHTVGIVGHSDADVLLHALCDALLGAAGLPDIGHHFPDTDARWKGADSKVLLREVVRLIGERGWRVGNVDCSLVMERPKIKPHIPAMKRAIAPILGVEEDAVGIKATTNEKLGYVGREEGVCAYAVALIAKG